MAASATASAIVLLYLQRPFVSGVAAATRFHAVVFMALAIVGGLLVLAGAYIMLFWTIELAGVTGGPVASTVLLVERASSRLTTLIGERPILWGVAFTVIAGLSTMVALRARRQVRAGQAAVGQQAGASPGSSQV